MGRKKFTATFKAKVAIEALKGHKTITELSSEFGVHATQINTWKKQLIDGSESMFSDKNQKTLKSIRAKIEQLYTQIGRQQVELDWLKKKTGHLD